MKKIPMKHQDGADFDAAMEELEQFDAGVDGVEGVDTVLVQVDKLLEKYGLEVVVPDGAGLDMCFFSIQRRAK